MLDRRIGMTAEFVNKYGKMVQHPINKIVKLKGGGKAIEIFDHGHKSLLPILPSTKIF